MCVSQVFITQIEKQLFFFYTSSHLQPLEPRASCSGAVSDISDPGFLLSVLADRGAADRRWGNFPGAGKSADNHTFHGATERTLAVQRRLGEFLSPLPTPSVRVRFCLLVLCVTCSFFVFFFVFFLCPNCSPLSKQLLIYAARLLMLVQFHP